MTLWRDGERFDLPPRGGPFRNRGLFGESNGWGGGDESAVVKGVKLVDLWASFECAMYTTLWLVLKMEDAVLVELADPTPLSKSPGTHSLSSWIVEVLSTQRLPRSPPLGSVTLSIWAFGAALGRDGAKGGLDSLIDGDLGLFRN